MGARELLIMVHSLAAALKSFLWSISLVFVLCIIFAGIFTEGTLAFCVRNGLMNDDSTAELRQHFGSVFRSVLTLYQAMSGGIDWSEAYTLACRLGFWFQAVFLLFIS